LRLTKNEQRIARVRAVITGERGRQLGRELDGWLYYWEAIFRAKPGRRLRGVCLTRNQARLEWLAEILRASRSFGRLLDGALPYWERCRRMDSPFWVYRRRNALAALDASRLPNWAATRGVKLAVAGGR
jgi:hypothetical protein